MKIIDCFIFYNEIELLNYRLNILHKVVDYFIIVESRHTFIGKEKPLFFELNKSVFEKFQDKIIHIIVEDFPHKYPNINISNGEQWNNERYQRNCIKNGFDKIKLNDDDILVITDIDEIPNRDILEKIKNNEINITINVLEMDFYYCNLNHKKKVKWPSARIISYDFYKKLSLTINDIRFYSCSEILNAGWHLSYFGNGEFIKNKIENFSHQELNIPIYTDIKNINKRLISNADVFDRQDKNNIADIIPVKDNSNLPHEYEIYLKNFVLF